MIDSVDMTDLHAQKLDEIIKSLGPLEISLAKIGADATRTREAVEALAKAETKSSSGMPGEQPKRP